MRSMILMTVGAAIIAGCAEEPKRTNNESADLNLTEIAASIINDELSEREFNALSLSDDETRDLLFEVGLLRGMDPNDLEELLYGEADNNPGLRGACTQDVEKANLSGDTYSSTHYQNSICDADPNDVDWLYEFYPSWADDSNDIRWYSTNFLVRSTFDAVYGGLLTGYTLCSSPVTLCIGTNGVTLAGGHNTVASSLFISH